MMSVCPKCGGAKKYRDMGYMLIKCQNCKGTGSVIIKDVNQEQSVIKENDQSLTKDQKKKKKARDDQYSVL